MKKMLAKLLVLGLVITNLTGCNISAMVRKELEEPDKEVVEEDVLEYIQKLIDENAQIDYFQESDSELDDTDYTVTCDVSYSSDAASYVDQFIAIYEYDDDEWELDKISVNEDYSKKSKEAATPEEESVEETVVEETKEEKKTDTKKASAVSGEVSDEWTDFMFELEGVVYQLPFSYSTFVENGWTIDAYDEESEDDEIVANAYDYYKFTNGSVTIRADVINMSGDVRPVKECTIGSVTVYAKNNLDFYIAKGITCTSTPEEVQEAFGIPSSSNTGDGYQSIRYKVDYNQDIEFYFDTEHPTNNYITISNYVETEADQGEVTDEVPEYLSTYKAPKKLGTDITATVFELDGALYQLPCPLSAFTDNGWTVSSKDYDSLGAGNYGYSCVKITKGDNKIYLGMINLSKKAAYIENCAVYKVEFDPSYYMKNAPDDYVKMPNDITFATTQEEIAKICSTYSKNEGTSSTSYTYEDSNYTVEIKYYFYDEEKIRISIENKNWNY